MAIHARKVLGVIVVLVAWITLFPGVGISQVEQFQINRVECHSPDRSPHGASVAYVPSDGGLGSITIDTFVFVWACGIPPTILTADSEASCGPSCDEFPVIGNPYLRRWNQHLGFLDDHDVRLNSPAAASAVNFLPSCAVQRSEDPLIKVVWSHWADPHYSVPFQWAEIPPYPFHAEPIDFTEFSPVVHDASGEADNSHAPSTAFSETNYVTVWNEYHGLFYDGPPSPGGGGIPPSIGGTGTELATDRIGPGSLPCVTAGLNDRFVATWCQATGNPPYGIRASRIGEGSAFRVGSTQVPVNPAIAAFDDASFVIAWVDGQDVKMARYTSPTHAAVLDRPAIVVNDDGDNWINGQEKRMTVVAPGSGLSDPDGRIVVVWTVWGTPSCGALKYRTFDASGTPLHETLNLVDPGLPGGGGGGLAWLGQPGMHPAVLREDKTLAVAWQKCALNDKNLYATIRVVP